MRTSGSLQLYSILLIFLTTFSAAWPWPRWLPDRDSLIVRQDSSSMILITASSGVHANNNQVPQPKQQAPKPAQHPPRQTAATTGSSTGTGKASTGSKTGSITSTGKGSTSKTPTTTSYDASNAAGGVSIMTPAISSGMQYFKVGQNVTFGWNYTSLLATPSAVDIVATCTANQQLYTIAANQTVANSTGMVIWDTGAYQATAVSDPLLTQTYTLIIYDAASSISATAQPGYLAVYNQYTFGMYTPQAYVGVDDGWVCATCSAGFGDTERRALGLMFGMAALTVLSFTWFVNGLGVVW
ncbi:hypothetical protein LSUE1_G009140 [Lachnellula suecica]|uniref:DUF7137 domain-containing protein n=1 Tax=Lachnellula suecica TaxID=602035 RepID=A0A8T9C105_9HELO|nr:hypothetical protein LSUE1_G009140 [Lachnellula suecica]